MRKRGLACAQRVLGVGPRVQLLWLEVREPCEVAGLGRNEAQAEGRETVDVAAPALDDPRALERTEEAAQRRGIDRARRRHVDRRSLVGAERREHPRLAQQTNGERRPEVDETLDLPLLSIVHLPASRRRPQRRVVEGVVDRVDGRARRDDLVDPVEHRLVEDDVGGGELALELLHRARPDDRGGDRGVVEHEGDGELDEGDAGLVGELRELLDGVELALVGGQREVEALGQPLGARRGLLAACPCASGRTASRRSAGCRR